MSTALKLFLFASLCILQSASIPISVKGKFVISDNNNQQENPETKEAVKKIKILMAAKEGNKEADWKSAKKFPLEIKKVHPHSTIATFQGEADFGDHKNFALGVEMEINKAQKEFKFLKAGSHAIVHASTENHRIPFVVISAYGTYLDDEGFIFPKFDGATDGTLMPTEEWTIKDINLE